MIEIHANTYEASNREKEDKEETINEILACSYAFTVYEKVVRERKKERKKDERKRNNKTR